MSKRVRWDQRVGSKVANFLKKSEHYITSRNGWVSLKGIFRWLFLEPMIPPKRFDFFLLTGGCSEGLGTFRFFFKKIIAKPQTF